jgi:hypothetical protein
LEQALGVSEKDVKDASAGVLQDLKRFQKEKEEDLRRYMVSAFYFPGIIVLTFTATGRVCTLPSRLGTQEPGNMDRGSR